MTHIAGDNVAGSAGNTNSYVKEGSGKMNSYVKEGNAEHRFWLSVAEASFQTRIQFLHHLAHPLQDTWDSYKDMAPAFSPFSSTILQCTQQPSRYPLWHYWAKNPSRSVAYLLPFPIAWPLSWASKRNWLLKCVTRLGRFASVNCKSCFGKNMEALVLTVAVICGWGLKGHSLRRRPHKQEDPQQCKNYGKNQLSQQGTRGKGSESGLEGAQTISQQSRAGSGGKAAPPTAPASSPPHLGEKTQHWDMPPASPRRDRTQGLNVHPSSGNSARPAGFSKRLLPRAPPSRQAAQRHGLPKRTALSEKRDKGDAFPSSRGGQPLLDPAVIKGLSIHVIH